MAIIVWPDTLPTYVNREGFARSFGDGRLKSVTDVGPGKTRRKSSAVVRPFTAVMTLTGWQFVRFEKFWDEDTKGGSLPFSFPAVGRYGFPLRSAGGSRLLAIDGSALRIRAWWLVQFAINAEPPAVRSRGNNPTSGETVEVSFNLEILP